MMGKNFARSVFVASKNRAVKVVFVTILQTALKSHRRFRASHFGFLRLFRSALLPLLTAKQHSFL